MNQPTVYDVAIIGAGSMGMSAAAYVTDKKLNALIIDAFNPPHTNGSHHGATRMIRHAYGEGREYVSLVKRAQQLWEELEQRSGYKIFERTGVIGLGPKDSPFLEETIAAAKRYQLPLDVLSGEEINERWPGFRVPKHFIGCYETTSGIIYSEQAIQAYKEIAMANGATFLMNTPVQHIDETTENGIVMMTNQGKYYAKKVIITVGAWVKSLLPQLNLPVSPTRKAFGWFEAPQNLYDAALFPSFYVEDGDNMCYGFPNVDGTGLKMGRSDGGQPIDPNKHIQNFGAYDTDETELRFFLEKFMPNANGALIQGKTCMYTNSVDSHFIIDHHPENDAIIFACGFSGHGFKFASSIGEALGEMAIRGEATNDLSIFSLNRFQG